MKKTLIKFIDRYFGIPLCFILYFFGLFKRKPKEIKNILVIMFWGIGSNINSSPVLKALKKKYPKADLSILIPKKNEDLFYKNKYVDNKLFVDLSIIPLIKLLIKNKNRFDLVIDTEHWLNISAIISYFLGRRRIGFSNRIRSLLYTDKVKFDKTKHALINNLRLAEVIGANLKSELEKIIVSGNNKKYVNDFFNKNKIKGFVVGLGVGTGTTVPERRWPEENFAKLADLLAEKYKASIVLFGSKREIPLMNKVKSLMKSKVVVTGFDLGKTIYLVEKCSLFIGNDGGLIHISAAQGVKTIALFGPETPVIFGPFNKHNISLFKGIECSPCIKIYEGKYMKCKYKENKCLKLISVGDVLGAVRKLK